MPNWIAVCKVGNYPQGNITSDILNRMALSYDKSFQAAPFISAHRKFNENGVMIDNPSALAWVEEVKADDTYLYVKVEDSNNDLDWLYNGLSYRYASIEIELVKKDNNEVEYLGAVAVTNFPAANIPAIMPGQVQAFANGNKIQMYSSFNKISIENSKENVMNEQQLAKAKEILSLAASATAEDVIAKLNKMKSDFESNEQLKQYATQFENLIKTFSKKEDDQPQTEIAQLTATVNNLVQQLNAQKQNDLESAIDKAIADEKFVPAEKEHLLKAYAGKIDDFKSYAAAKPKLQLNQPFTAPKDLQGNDITYNEVLSDAALYEKMQRENPVMLDKLKAEWLKNPSAKKESK